MDMLGRDIKERIWLMLLADDIVLCSTRKAESEMKIQEWRRAKADQTKISRKKMEYLRWNKHNDRDPVMEEVKMLKI